MVGQYRDLAAAAIRCALPGLALLAVGAAELAWLALVPAAALAALVWVRRPLLVGLLVLLAVLPLSAALDAARLRETFFHGFYPRSIPLGVYAALLLAPYSCAIAFLWQRRRPLSGQQTAWRADRTDRRTDAREHSCRRRRDRGRRADPGALVAALSATPCSEASYQRWGLSCEVQAAL